jgi:hypothetical protein
MWMREEKNVSCQFARIMTFFYDSCQAKPMIFLSDFCTWKESVVFSPMPGRFLPSKGRAIKLVREFFLIGMPAGH